MPETTRRKGPQYRTNRKGRRALAPATIAKLRQLMARLHSKSALVRQAQVSDASFLTALAGDTVSSSTADRLEAFVARLEQPAPTEVDL